MKQLIAFDLDGTLALSKQPIDEEIAMLLNRLIKVVSTAVMSGGDWPRFQTHLLGRLSADTDLERLYLLPTSGAKLYQYRGSWRRRYADLLSPSERLKLIGAIDATIAALNFATEPVWDRRFEDRGTQITFSGLGQHAPLDANLAWDPSGKKRSKIQAVLQPLLSGFTVRIGGSTSIDVTRNGVDKGSGITRLSSLSAIPCVDSLFVGDALYAGGNDEALSASGIDCISVRDVKETKHVIEAILFSR
ncbi:HAD-IIB family hydrolase [soil metagenome]